MAFISLLFVSLGVIISILLIGTASIITGTVLYHKKKHEKLGIAFRILGYVILIPPAVFILIALASFIIQSVSDLF